MPVPQTLIRPTSILASLGPIIALMRYDPASRPGVDHVIACLVITFSRPS